MANKSKERPLVLVDFEEQDKIDRSMLAWANTFPRLPADIYKALINYEFLPADVPGMAFSTIQSANVTRNYITGGYEAEYQFKIIYRVKPGNSSNKKLAADELLNGFGAWAEKSELPNIGDGLKVLKIKPTTRSGLFAVYENGDEDHQILMQMTYERMA